MSTGKLWATSPDGKFDYISLTHENVEKAMNVMRGSFFIHENVCIAVDLPQCPGAAEELEELSLRAGKDGVSVIAVEKSTQKVVGVAFNKIQVKNDIGESTYFEKFAADCKFDSSKCFVQLMSDVDAACNLFDHYNVDCLVEIMCLATLPEFRRKGIAKKLCEVSEMVARELLSGNNVKFSLTDEPLSIEPVPKAISTTCTSFITKKIGDQLGYKTLAEISYEKFSFQGRSFASKIGESTKSTTLAAKFLI